MSFDPVHLPLPPGLLSSKWAEWIDYRCQAGGVVTEGKAFADLATMAGWLKRGFDVHALIDLNIKNGFQRLSKPNQVNA